jgi:hypothetical protein
MSAAADRTENLTLDFWLKANSQTTTAPATVYVALFNSDDSAGLTAENLEAGTITDECGGGAYARQAVTFGTVSGGSVSNSADVTFPAATDGNWGTITHVAVMDASSAGNVLFYGALTGGGKTIENSDTFQITTGNLTVSLA